MEGGDANVAQWLKDEGINAPIGSVLKVRQSPFSPPNCFAQTSLALQVHIASTTWILMATCKPLLCEIF